MRCPFCGHADTSVKDSRTTDDQSSIRRRRFCGECGSRFTTFERVQLRDLLVVKKNGIRAPFDRDKLAHSITTAMHKRSLEPERVDRVVSGIVRQLETSGEPEISTHALGEMMMQALFNLDPVAYVRFASIYKEFSNVGDFVDFIKKMEHSTSQG
ncbi:MAG: transcriptional regulator NrdR [Alphaproteobacteria bacterium]|nr:transcriptional regulator NrdR [Alphaproteobacteria bacterium]